MKINWFQIENFRSIIDSGKCFLNSGVTVLAGKNESGKSNLLKALECFSNDELLDNSPLNNSDENSRVTVSFTFTRDELEEHIGIEENKVNEFELIIKRSAKYIDEHSGSCFETMAGDLVQENIVLIDKMFEIVAKISRSTKKSYKPYNIEKNCLNIDDNLLKYTKAIESTIPGLEENARIVAIDMIKEVKSIIILRQENLVKIKEIKDLLNEIVPKFVLFDSFEDILPDHVTQEEVANKKIMARFCKVANLDVNALFSETNGQRRKMITESTSANISGDFASYYKQDSVKLKIDLDGPKLNFYVYDDEKVIPFKPEQRSKGFQWFLSFYLTLSAECNDRCILLIDEPGLYLHPKAQEDILHVLEDISNDRQVVFTTHSPYLLDPDRLDRIRLVLKNKDKHTKVENKIHKGADKDTMTPVITSIGLDLTKGLTFSAKSNILLEGISDYYYIQAMRTYLNDDCALNKDTRLIPSVGADQIPNMAALLFGWEVDFKVLLDNDKKGISVSRKLLNDLRIEEDKVVLLNSGENISIEDVFSKKDFHSHVLDKDYDDSDELNSKIAKKHDKVLLAKKFSERVHGTDSAEIEFEDETLTNFNSLFTSLVN